MRRLDAICVANAAGESWRTYTGTEGAMTVGVGKDVVGGTRPDAGRGRLSGRRSCRDAA